MPLRIWPTTILAAALGFLACEASGCSYTSHRYGDFLDIGRVGVGIGLGTSVRATPYLQKSFCFTMVRARMLGKKVPGAEPPIKQGFPPLVHFFQGIAARTEGVMGASWDIGVAPVVHFRGHQPNVFEGKDETRTMVLTKTILNGRGDNDAQRWYDSRLWSVYPGIGAYEENYDRRFFDIGLSLYLGPGLDVDFNPYELLDFLAGFFGADISGDDEVPEESRLAKT